MKRLAVLISNKGTGTNLQAMIDGSENKKINAKIVVVVSDTEDAVGLERAKTHHIPIAICPEKEQLITILYRYNPDYICLTGWKQLITKDVIEQYGNMILNIHPGLIPNEKDDIVKNPDGSDGLWNKGKLTGKAIQNFIDTKATYAGSSLHFLSHDFDYGPVLGRVFEKIEPNDTIDSLYSRLKKKENELYVEVLAKLCNDS